MKQLNSSVRISLLTTLILAYVLPAQAVKVTFDSMKQLVETKNDRVVGQVQKLKAAQLREGVFVRSYLPKIFVTGGYESFEVGTSISERQPYFGIEGTLNVFNGGNDKIDEEVRWLQSDINQNEIKITVSKELATARELYWNIIYLKTEKELLAKMIRINEQNLNSANKRIKAGVATPSDRLEFEMKRLDLERNITRLNAKQKAMSFDLLVHLGFEVHEPLELLGQLEHLDEWEQDLKHTHEDHEFFVKPSELTAKVIELEKLKLNRSWLPTVDMYASWHQFTQREEDPVSERERQESAVGIKLKLDLMDKLTKQNELRALGADANAATAYSSFRKKENEAHIEKEFLELKVLHGQVHEFEKYILMAERYYRATEAEYIRGAKNSPDVLSATEKLEDVTRIKYQQIRDFQIALSHVLSKIGK